MYPVYGRLGCNWLVVHPVGIEFACKLVVLASFLISSSLLRRIARILSKLRGGVRGLLEVEIGRPDLFYSVPKLESMHNNLTNSFDLMKKIGELFRAV